MRMAVAAPPPFITSTLQQEASRKLGVGAATAMRIAQRLYEGVDIGGETVGLITYMRTDGVQLAPEAIGQTRRLIESKYGQNYVPAQPRVYTSKAKNAQEAHEAVRPTDLFRLPQDVAQYLDKDQLALYELIWKRTVASQMESAVLDQVTVDIASGDKTVQLRTTGSVVKFPGFLTLYDEGRDEKTEEDENATILPDVQEAEGLDRREVVPEQHFTEPPPRYSEASLVKKLEELGIGRPSTYASIIEVLQRRNYVKVDRKRFIPEDRGRIVTSFLQTYFPRYVEYGFTAHLEEELDDISSGKAEWHQVLREFWKAFSAAVGETKELRVREVLDKLDEELGPHFFPANDNPGAKSPRVCPSCADGRLGLKLGKFGAFIGCSNYPTCKFTRKLGIVDPEKDALSGANLNEPKLLGVDAATGKEVTLRNGPYGLYIQLGVPEGKEKPKRASLLKGMTPEELTFEKAQAILALPRELGPHPEDKEPVLAGVGRFGPYVRHGSKYKSIPADESVLEIGMNRAVALLAEAKATGRGRAAVKPIRIVGNHPADNAPIELYDGRYGMYVKHASINATVPRDLKPEELTIDQAVSLLAERAAKGGGKKPKATRAKKAAPVAANDSGEKPAKAKKKAAPKKKAAKAKTEEETPPRTGTDG